MNSPLVSILMPCYNNADYIGEAIESILCQSLQDFELIVLDDCSTDNSAEIISSFADERIVYHHNEQNMGLANNLNIGIRMACGKYIARMDGDDISLPDRLKTQIDFLETHPDIALCSCGMEMFGKDNMVWIRQADYEQVKIVRMPSLPKIMTFGQERFSTANWSIFHKLCTNTVSTASRLPRRTVALRCENIKYEPNICDEHYPH